MTAKVKKPKCKLKGQNGNVFNLLAIVRVTLKDHNMTKEADEVQNRVFKSKSYEEALTIFAEYVEVV